METARTRLAPSSLPGLSPDTQLRTVAESERQSVWVVDMKTGRVVRRRADGADEAEEDTA